MTELNGTGKGRPCPERKNEAEHCWHAWGTATQGNGAAIFTSVCCFCCPDWMHTDVYIPHTVSPEEATAVQMKHGKLVTIIISPRRGPSLAVVRN